MGHSSVVDSKLISGYSHIHPAIAVKDSPIEGKGLFITTGLPAGTVLFDIIAEKIHHPYDPNLSGQNPNWIGSGYEEWLRLGPGDIAIYLNHACEANVIINEKLELITIREIAQDTELLLDYSTTELDPYWSMECSCGCPSCRKLLRAFQFLPLPLQREYGKYISPVFIRTAEALAKQPLSNAQLKGNG